MSEQRSSLIQTSPASNRTRPAHNLYGGSLRWGRSTYGMNAVWNNGSGYKSQSYANGIKDYSNSPRSHRPLKIEKIYKPSTRFMIADAEDRGGYINGQNGHFFYDFHAGSVNMLFGDFHVEGHKLANIPHTGWNSSTPPYAAAP